MYDKYFKIWCYPNKRIKIIKCIIVLCNFHVTDVYIYIIMGILILLCIFKRTLLFFRICKKSALNTGIPK